MNPVAAKLLPWLLSKGGIAIRYVTGLIIGKIAADHVVPSHSLETIQDGLERGGYALLAIAYGYLQLWIHNHQTANATALQRSLNSANKNLPPIKEDGWIGNETIQAFTDRTGIEVRRAIPLNQ